MNKNTIKITIKKYIKEKNILKKTKGASTRHWPNHLKTDATKINTQTKHLLILPITET